MPTLNWVGKDKVINHHMEVPYKVLEPQYSYGNQNSPNDNLIIHGDNLLALKSLLPKYEGKIKCIYIDPPYNTGNENWVYNDNVNDPKLKKWLGAVVGKEAEDLSRHDKWLCMMYPRLKLLHKLLANDGAIFISIDDNEQANLKLIMDEIFGITNFVASFQRRRRKTQANLTKFIAPVHEYILMYARNIKKLSINRLPLREEYVSDMYKNPDNDPRGPWRTKPLASPDNSTNKEYELTMPNGRKISAKWRVKKETFEMLVKENMLVIPREGEGMPNIKIFLNENEGQIPNTWIDNSATNEAASKEIELLFGTNAIFNSPKPTELIKLLLTIGSDKDSIILDSFAGSGTTAQAVLHLNKQDGGNRKFILVEMESYAETITAERVRRVINGYANVEGTGGGFTFYTLGEPLFLPDGNLNEKII